MHLMLILVVVLVLLSGCATYDKWDYRAAEIQEHGQGLCMDRATVMAREMQAQGLKPVIVYGQLRRDGWDQGHARVFCNGKYYDPSLQIQPNDFKPRGLMVL